MAKISGQNNMFQALADSTGKLLTKSPPDDLLVDVFSIIGNTIDLDMISLYKNEEKNCFEQVSWSKSTDSNLFDAPETFFTHPFQKSLEKNSNFQAITSSLKPKLPFKERLTRQKVQSILTIPLFCSDTFWGFIEYKDCSSERKWSSDEEAFLGSFSKSISNKIENCETEDELHNFGIFSMDSPFPIIRIDTFGNVLLRNKAGKKITYLEIEEKKRKDIVLFMHLARTLNAKKNQLAVQGKFKSDDYLAKVSYSSVTGAITIFLKNTSKIDPQLFTESLSYLKLFHTLIDNLDESIQISLENGQLIYVNKIAGERLGISSNELKNFNIRDYGKTLENDSLWDEHLSFLKNNKSIVVEGENINQKTGKSFASETTVKYLIFDDIGYNVASTRDISKRKENENRLRLLQEKRANELIIANKELTYQGEEKEKRANELIIIKEKDEQSDRLKGAFLGTMSHEIRTPLHAIIGVINELKKQAITSKQLLLVDSALSSSKYLLAILNNILDISKIESGEVTIDRNDFDLQDMLSEIVKILGPQAIEKNLQFKSSFDIRLSKIVNGDHTRLKQILINTIYNSIKFTEKGSVDINFFLLQKDAHEQEILIKIIDTGHGISEEHLKKIFTKFNQEDVSVAKRNGGTGLGLFISKQLIELMGGSISISSIEKVGTTASIKLKLLLGNEKKIRYLKDIKRLDLLTAKTILLVEDNLMSREITVNILNEYNAEIIQAENGIVAIKKLKNKPVDLIIMDLQMPLMGGLETTRIIREELKMNTPIIAVTANALLSEKIKCLKSGFNDYITKPFESQQLMQSIYNQFNPEKLIKFQQKKSKTGFCRRINQLYDLSILKNISNDDHFITKMLQIYITTTPELIEDIKYNFKTKNFENLQKIAHSLKASIDNLGILSLQKEIRELEIYQNPEEDFDKYTKLVNIVCDVLHQVVKELQQLLLDKN